MRISMRWLGEWVRPLPAPEKLAELLTGAGIEVEAIEKLGEGLDEVVVGQVLSKTPVEGSTKLNLCSVDVGRGEPLSIVCGAANYREGDKVPTALVGAVLPGGMKIEARKLRGVPSHGMLCSERELGLSEEGEGLMILEADAPVGMPIVQHLDLEDVVLTIAATPNRPDWLSHLGVAREVAALTGAELVWPEVKFSEEGGPIDDKASVSLEWEERCSRYAARVVEGVRFGPSPRWMRARLEACGMRSRGNLVDVTNYVLLETGQPLHAFDLDKVRGGRIRVRAAANDEKLVTLDGKERTLSSDDLVIADAERALVLAGVMGGEEAEVGETTTRILLESAHFHAPGIRRSSRRHGLHTESSHRFERGCDPEAVRFALDRAAQLLVELAGGKVAAGVIDHYPGKREPETVRVRFSRVRDLLGAEVSDDSCRKILSDLGFVEVEAEEGAGAYRVPSFRVDVSREADLVEEIARIHGYDAIPETPSRPQVTAPAEDRASRVLAYAAEVFAAFGLDETVHLAFADPEGDAKILREETAHLMLRNPLAEHQRAMRTSLLPALLRTAESNLNHGAERLRFWEQGKVFLPQAARDMPVREEERLAGLLLGPARARSWAEPERPVDFYDLKGVLEALFDELGIRDLRWEPSDRPFLHPRSACEVRAGEISLGILGELHPLSAEALGLPRGVFVFELLLAPLVELADLRPHHRGVPRFPAVLRDLAVVVPREVTAAQVAEVLRGPKGAGWVEEVELFDVYEGPQVGEGKKSLAFAIRYRHPEKTLSDRELQPVHDGLVAELGRKLGAELRG